MFLSYNGQVRIDQVNKLCFFHHFIHVNTNLIIKPKQSGLHTFPLLNCTNHHDLHLKIETVLMYVYNVYKYYIYIDCPYMT